MITFISDVSVALWRLRYSETKDIWFQKGDRFLQTVSKVGPGAGGGDQK